MNDLCVDIAPNSAPVYFSLYLYDAGNNSARFFFIANKGAEGYLVPEIKKADYFLMIRNYIAENELENILSALNGMPEIAAAVKIDPKKIKSRENLLF